ncbi:polysaccharide biosynthesis tyrosine autokinase [Pseudoxanthomonas helianthi]|uniref:Polysaccharide biosynthesis tyrosine autokinase n=1 Tax=Pseudoxanthomonas helianthi TaxID=1453541 RepID=A0A940X5K5_9GAMM|nr:polysaccharide biosynthesis tyrosine autokinase [Pseudoxanthomonas helianthi]MBP3985331.1 polysaccharide biosynthesis tyrosine autokinase [Pseudoxanthomonas helianthi]
MSRRIPIYDDPRIHPVPVRDDDVDLPGLVGTLLEHKRLVLFGTLAFLLASIAYVMIATPRYEANAVIQVENRTPGVPGVDEEAALPAAPTGDAASTEIQLMGSRHVFGEAVKKLGLDIEIEPARFPLVGDYFARRFQSLHPGALASPWRGFSRYGWGGESLEVARLDVPQALYDVPLQLVAGEGGRYVLADDAGRVLVEGRVGQPVKANGIAMQVKSMKANPGMRFGVTRRDDVSLVDQLKRDIEVSEQGRSSGVIALSYASPDPVRARRLLDEVTQAYVRQNVDRNSAEAAKRLEFVTAQLPKVRDELAKAQAALRDFQANTQTMDVATQNKALLDQALALDSGLNQLRIQATEVTGRFTPQHPTYQALQRQISQFQRDKASLQSRIRQLPDAEQGLFRLNSDVQITSQTYANLLDQAQRLNIAAASAVGNARIIDPAAVNLDQPAWPKPLPTVAIGTALGAMLMVAFVLLRQMFRRGIEDPADIEMLGLPVYASIPHSSRGRELTEDGARRGLGRKRLLALRAPTDLAMEAVRALRTSLHFTRMRNGNNLLMIAAPSPAVGKTFVCANLAMSIAQAGQRVLLVDADMRRGSLHHALGMRCGEGLSELLSGRIDAAEAIRPVKGADGLFFISRGAVPSNPSELLMRNRFADVLGQLSSRYDAVVIDTPPVLAVTDAALIGQNVGTCLMVVRWGLNRQREIVLAKRRLEQNGVEVDGAIFNGVENRGAGQYAYSHYEYVPMRS